MRIWAMLLLLLGSEVLGVLLGEWFYRLFRKTVPPLAISNFNAESAHAAFILYGLGAGFAIFLWAILANGIGRGSLWRSSGTARAAHE